MPRAPDGTFSLPSGTLVNTGDTLLTSQHNPALLDIASAMSASLDRDGLGGMRAALAMGGFAITDLLPGTNPTDAATVGQLSDGAGAPVGTVIDFAGSTVPTGWLVCAGQSLVRADYAALFAVIGTTYGSASGTTFTLPDCRGRTTAGRDLDQGGLASRLTTTMAPNGTTLGATGGGQSVTLTTAQLAAHTHTGTANSSGDHSHSVNAGGSVSTGFGGGNTAAADVGDTTSVAGAHTHSLDIATAGGGEAHPNVQPTILFNKLIKAV
jgi:microcystin-dependent protein